MAWSKTPADRRRDNAVYGPEWRKARAQALARDGHSCVMDGSTLKLTVDHIVPVSQGGTHQLTNLRTLCQKCHLHKTAMEGRGYRDTSKPDPQARPSTAWLCTA